MAAMFWCTLTSAGRQRLWPVDSQSTGGAGSPRGKPVVGVGMPRVLDTLKAMPQRELVLHLGFPGVRLVAGLQMSPATGGTGLRDL
ncbi:MAG: hypothetical protein JNM66_12860 [Bryobacterales bacterium]|nr:hypothetical protein [Bryobacterales bacterium]